MYIFREPNGSLNTRRYEGLIDLDSIKDPMERKSVELQILDFGQTPAQLLKTQHPSRMTLEEMAKPSSKSTFYYASFVLTGIAARQMVLHTFSALLPPTLTNSNKDKGSTHPAIYCYRRPGADGATLPLVHIGTPPTRKKGSSGNVVLVYRDGVVGVHQYDTKEDIRALYIPHYNFFEYCSDRNGEDPSLSWILDKNVRARQFDSLLRSTSIVCIDNCFVLTADGKYQKTNIILYSLKYAGT